MDTPVERDETTAPEAGDPDRQPRESVLRTVGIAVALALAALLVPAVVLGVLGAVVLGILFGAGLELGTTGVAVLVGVALLAQFGWFVALGIWYLSYRGFTRREIKAYIGVDRPSVRDIGLILGTWLAMIVTLAAVAVLVTQVIPELLGAGSTEAAENQNPLTDAVDDGPGLLVVGVVIAFMFLVVGPAEEILFRGVIQSRLRERFSPVLGIVLASAIFAAAHVTALVGASPGAIANTIAILFVPSIGFGVLYEYTGNVVVPTLLHGFHNSMVVLLIYAAAVGGTEEAAVLDGLTGLV